MKLVSIMATKAIRLLPVMSATGGNLYGSALSKALEARYGFLQGPRTVAEYDMSKGITFLHGRISGQPVMEKLIFFNDGLVCDTRADSAAADSFIDDVIKWATEDQAFDFEGVSNAKRAYISNLDFHMDADIGKALKGFEEFCQQITSTIRGYGQETAEYGPARIGFHGDMTTVASKSGPPGFIVERREAEPYELGRYFSSAPLTTHDHLKFLNNLEQLFLAKSGV